MRRISRKVNCGGVMIGGGEPVSIQSMTNTKTADVDATVDQIRRLEDAGCQIVRCTVPDTESAEALGIIKKRVKIPVVADIHFDYRLAIASIENGADKIRINPGNIGSRERIEAVAKAAKTRGIPIRVGVNSGSLEKEILEKYGGVTAEGIAESALKNASLLTETGFEDIVISVKSSDPVMNLEAHRLLAKSCDLPIHAGLTESGTAAGGIIKSAVGLGSILMDGIGDTVRVSLAGDPVAEIPAARDILSACGLLKGRIDLVVCPTCGRTRVDLPAIAQEIENIIRALEVRAQKGSLKVRELSVAVMGCAVNGPGEARNADLGIACGDGDGLLFRKGEIIEKLNEKDITSRLAHLIEEAYIIS